MEDDRGERCLSEEQEHSLAPVLDEVIPPREDGRLPGAGQRSPRGFAALAREERLAVLGEVLAGEPMFLGMLMFHTYVGYYRDPRVASVLGLAARPPHPAGYPVEPSDLTTLLEPVRGRGKLYRES